MRGVKLLTVIVPAGVLAAIGVIAMASTDPVSAPEGPRATITQARPKAEFRRVRGEVTAVEPSANPPTLTMKAMEGKQEMTVGVDVTDKTIIREGKARKTLADIKTGDRVWMKYERTDGKLVADYIRILKPAHVASKSASSNKSY